MGQAKDFGALILNARRELRTAEAIKPEKRPKAKANRERRKNPLKVVQRASEIPAAPKGPIGRPKNGKRSNPDWAPCNLFLRKETVKKLRTYLLIQRNDEIDLSEQVDALCVEWMKANGAG